MNNKYDGEFVFYYRNGNRRMQGNYVNEKKVGTWKYWYENGYSKAIIYHDSNDIKYFINYWDELGNQQLKNGNGQPKLKLFYSNSSLHNLEILTNVSIKDSIPIGTWKIEYKNMKGNCELVFKDGKVSQKKFYDLDNENFYTINSTCKIDIENYSKHKLTDKTSYKKIDTTNTLIQSEFDKIKYKKDYEKIVKHAELMPHYIDGESGMYNYIARNLKYPDNARKKGIEGKVIVQFLIGIDGSVKDVYAIKEIGYGCGEAAIKVIRDMGKWIPGMQDGKPCEVWFTIPLMFSLE